MAAHINTQDVTTNLPGSGPTRSSQGGNWLSLRNISQAGPVRFCGRVYDKSGNMFVCMRIPHRGSWVGECCDADTVRRTIAGVEKDDVPSRRKGGAQQRFSTQVRVVRVPLFCSYLQAYFVATHFRKIIDLLLYVPSYCMADSMTLICFVSAAQVALTF